MKVRLAVAGGVVVALVATLLLYRVLRPRCADIGSWDECEAAWHCSPGHISAAEGYTGPIWFCETR
ncbi:MAG: hypothetical protein KF718_13330 [Polyangiaceae bacterium]|nr:hypothetical protein [Polyangiaceae bacterium]